MGLFKSFKKMLAPIGGVVGFALGGPAGAALGSGIGSLAGGGDVKDALLAGALGFGAGSFAKKCRIWIRVRWWHRWLASKLQRHVYAWTG